MTDFGQKTVSKMSSMTFSIQILFETVARQYFLSRAVSTRDSFETEVSVSETDHM
jgi:hypothetical protein